MIANQIYYTTASGARVPMEYFSTFKIVCQRGIDASYFSFGIKAKESIDAVLGELADAAGSITIVTPHDSPDSPATLEWKGWYIVRVEAENGNNDSRVVTLADSRWRAAYRLVTAIYNATWPDGKWRADSLRFGSPWKTIDAIYDIIERFGLTPDRSVELVPVEMAKLECPKNLGNSDGGGYVAAPMESMLKPLLEHIACDLVPTIDGKFTVRSRNAIGINDPLAALKQTARLIDSVAKSENFFERPRKMKLHYEVLCETALEYDSNSRYATPSLVDIVNVIPDNNFLNSLDQLDNTVFKPVGEVAKNLGYVAQESEADALVARNWFKKFIVPLKYSLEQHLAGQAEDGEAVDKKIWFNDVVRSSWRKYWRIHFPTSTLSPSVGELRRFTGITLGRLRPDGGAQDQGAVWISHSIEHTRPTRGRGDYMEFEYSTNYPFVQSNMDTPPAPFTARWISEKGNELVFAVTPAREDRINQEAIFPALFNHHVSFGSWISARDGKPLEMEDTQASFKSDFKMRVMCFGRLVGAFSIDNVPNQAEIQIGPNKLIGRRFVIERDLFGNDGNVSEIELKSSEKTANLAYSRDQLLQRIIAGTLPDTLLNSFDLEAHADRVAEEVKQSITSGFAGSISCPGIGTLASGIFSGGSIYECAVRLGIDGQPFAITTEYIVMPNYRTMEVDRKSIEGKPARLAADD